MPGDHMRLRHRLASALAGSALAVAGLAAFAQNPFAQVGMVEADARERLQSLVEDRAPGMPGDIRIDPDMVEAAAKINRLPASARGPLVTQLYAWAKGVLMTPAFKARYLKKRTARKPEETVHTGTVDQELKERIAKETADQETHWKQMESMGGELKTVAAQQRKDWPQVRDQFI